MYGDVKVVECGPRDGLQNEAVTVGWEDKLEFIELLAAAGCRWIEAGSFVSPRLVPQMADSDQVIAALPKDTGVEYSALVPNSRGLERAVACGVTTIAIFTAATDEFGLANTGTTIVESLENYAALVREADALGVRTRGYVSVAFGCPYEGAVAPRTVARIAGRLLEMGCFEVALADTIGIGTPPLVAEVLAATFEQVGVEQLGLHFHDTHGQATANVQVGLEAGVRVFDSAASGLGGCPFAPGAPGNLSTEQLILTLHAEGYTTGIDPDGLTAASSFIRTKLEAVGEPG